MDHDRDPVSTESSTPFTQKQGQYLAFLYTYTLLNRVRPAEADFQRYFQVTPPSVHQMIVELERRGFITRVARQPRSITLAISPDQLPRLEPIKTSAARY